MTDRDPKPEKEELVRRPYHVYPTGNKGHVVDGTEPCWCKPRIEEGGYLIIHNDAPA